MFEGSNPMRAHAKETENVDFKPPQPATKPAHGLWVKYKHEGTEYYENTETAETSWERAEGFEDSGEQK